MATATEMVTTPATSKFRPWAMSADFYERMIEAGVFRKERVYLWKGQLVEKMVKVRPHTVTDREAHADMHSQPVACCSGLLSSRRLRS